MTAPDLDALEKLADEATPFHTESNGFIPRSAFERAITPATIKALIAEVRSLRTRVARWEPPMMTSTASSPCSAFLARNGKATRDDTKVES